MSYRGNIQKYPGLTVIRLQDAGGHKKAKLNLHGLIEDKKIVKLAHTLVEELSK